MITTNMFMFSTFDEHIFKELQYLLQQFILTNMDKRYSIHSSVKVSTQPEGLKFISLCINEPILFKGRMLKFISQNDGKTYEELSSPLTDTKLVKLFLEVLGNVVET